MILFYSHEVLKLSGNGDAQERIQESIELLKCIFLSVRRSKAS